MGELCSIYFNNNNATALDIKKEGRFLRIEGKELLELNALEDFLKDRKSLYLGVEIDEVIDENIDIASDIQSDEIIRKSILQKIGKAIAGNNVLSNYYKIFKNLRGKKTTYHIDGVKEKNYFDTLHQVGDLDKIKSATLSKFSYFCLSQKCIKNKSYFSIYAQENKALLLTIHDNIPIFARTFNVTTEDSVFRENDISEEITQTISYVQQQFRDIDFSLIALGGSLARNGEISEKIYNSTSIGVTTLYPNTFVLGLKNEQLQDYIIPLGNLFVPKKMQFLPETILSLRQFETTKRILLATSVVALLMSAFLAYGKYVSFYSSLQRYEIIKKDLTQMTDGVDTFSHEALSQSLRNLEIAQQYLQNNPVDLLLNLEKLINRIKPDTLLWKYHEDSLRFEIRFVKSFDSLEALYSFEKKFDQEFRNINKDSSFNYMPHTDYTKMVFNSLITLHAGNSTSLKEQRRRRR